MSYRTLMFDLDGTLVDPLPGFARSVNHALVAHGLAPRPESELARYIGPPLDGTFRALTGRDDPALLAALVASYRELYLPQGFKEATVYPGVAQALRQLYGRGQRLAVCTSKPEPAARQVLAHFDLLELFEFVSGGDVGIGKWQQIEGLLASGTVCGSSLMIGDRGVDLQAGNRNGVPAAAVTWGYGSREELGAESPAHVFERPDDWLHAL